MSANVADRVEAPAGGDVVELLRRLVQAPSPNPPGDERAAMAVVEAYLRAIQGVVVEHVGVAAERPMIVATLTGESAAGRTVIFGGHIDTVPAGDGWTRDPFGGEIIDGQLYGRGASDMKSGIAGFLVAMRQLAQQRDRWSGTIVAHIVPDEEPGGQLGTETLLERGLLRGDAAIVAEPSELTVYRAQKGNIFAQVRFTGRSAHGSTPHLGENAISRAMRAAIDLEERLGPQLARRRHELVGAATVSVGTIRGGLRTNMVPDECVITVDRRVIPGEPLDEAAAELRRFMADSADVTFEQCGAAFETPADHWLVRAAIEAVDGVRGASFPVGGLVGSSDARFYAAGAGIPTVIVGPGAMHQAHAPDERVDIALVRQSVDVYRELALRLLAPRSSANPT